MDAAGILLTGGASRRMGRDKAALRVDAEPGRPSLAERTATLLDRVAIGLVEVGPGRSHLPSITEDPPGGGPLVAVVAGWRHLSEKGWNGAVLVVATDLPLLTEAALRCLADDPAPGSVVPLAAGRLQPLCARYSPTDLVTAARLVEQGSRSMSDLLDGIDARVVRADEWDGPETVLDETVLDDVDTPADLLRFGRLFDAAVHDR